MQLVPVALGKRSYSIHIGSGLLKTLGEQASLLDLGRRCAVITDSRVGPLFASGVLKSLTKAGFCPSLIQVKAGEATKSLGSVEKCCNAMAKHRMERKSFVVALGGGVVGDLAGFAAACHLRGLQFIQIPTTLLAQVDSSVGGKTGVNLKAGKNLVGAFHQPRLVLCDIDTLKTLPDREFRAGLAEIIKYGVIQDRALFELLESQMQRILRRDKSLLTQIIARSCEIKADVVSQDETESGLRATLNFGHTIGHAIEAISGYGKYLHGEAISIGQVLAARLSEQCLGLPASDSMRIRQLFERTELPTSIRLNALQLKRLLEAMQLDKKVVGGQVKFVLARGIGRVEWGCAVPLDTVAQLMKSQGT
ncbi:MAG: 3-dehydroquinate synthase [Verrucomicrobia bacterium]|nr:3-dehydroquinate synthase [Verrucomicrobiota bacterium]